MKTVEKGIAVRLSISISLALVAAVLFVLNNAREQKTPEALEREFELSSRTIDKEIDLVLDHFGIEKTWVRRKEINDPAGIFRRIERRVAIPASVIPALLNRELNSLAHRFRGRAVATENLKENSVTIHIILQQTVVQTLILKVNPEIQKKKSDDESKKV